MRKQVGKYNIKNSFLKSYQLYAILEYGNTIVSKKYSEDEIIQEFKKHGVRVRIRQMLESQYFEVETHCIVEDVDRIKNAEVKRGI